MVMWSKVKIELFLKFCLIARQVNSAFILMEAMYIKHTNYLMCLDYSKGINLPI